MANEYTLLAEIHDTDTGTATSVSVMHQEDGNRGLEIVVRDQRTGDFLDIFKVRDICVLADTIGGNK